ncbi:biotin carboxylase N-terminal domain-containing protein [Ruegeria sp. PrR005]|uniref:ATP-grasp domain-containing protein n=1 Tax=Ruegeria sp. PrR005 TaxID=2706882 RepID=A0A6B2NHB6_9RHOB|nr:biotin carboxylase N-terminal domain-containing protein [Ruegeria sp. PrR005]NDW43552.1 ATP-grasp domain-containing protein [Ruegeria sp. PrR005]
MTIRRLLIANRGEIACRIIRTARRMGIGTVAVYSDADRDTPHVRAADAAYHIGPPEAAQSYLDAARLIAAARRAGADAVHPGYGFLSENANFAATCAEAGLAFVGPPAEVIRAMGSKIEARRLAAVSGVPVVAGHDAADPSDAELGVAADRIGFPLLVKASAGGGGRGMRIVRERAQLPAALAAARAEAQAGFGDATLFLERFLTQARHVEVQVLADTQGTVLHLFDRDCSLQRNHQKVIEEAPAPGLSDALRRSMHEAAVKLARSIGYVNAGTVEFLVDPAKDSFHFLEMNTRLQVEHPVTEMVTGLDLVEWQLRIAGGEALPFSQSDIVCAGAAVEARIAAEDPAAGYRPETGRIARFDPAPGCRTDTGIEEGSIVSHHYDSMLAKVIAQGPDRGTALARLEHGLAGMQVGGVVTNIGFLSDLCRAEAFARSDHHTGTIAELFPEGWSAPEAGPWHKAVAAMARILSDHPARSTPFETLGAWRLLPGGGAVCYIERSAVEVKQSGSRWAVTLPEGETFGFDHVALDSGRLIFEADGMRHNIGVLVDEAGVTMMTPVGRFSVAVLPGEGALLDRLAPGDETGTEIRAPMPGLVVEVLHPEGSRLKRGEPVVVLEAMKLMQTLNAPCDGVLDSLSCIPGETVEKHALLAAMTPEEENP